MIHIIVFMVTIYQGAYFCHGCVNHCDRFTGGIACRIENFEGLRELSHRVDSIQARDDQSIYQHAERKTSGILTNKNMCHPEGEKFECYNDSYKNHCVCHLEQPLDHNNSNISDNPSLTEMGEERNWKQTFLARCFNSNNV